MSEKNSKGQFWLWFKSIYFILCGVLALMLLIEINNHSICLDSDLADLCYVNYSDTLSDTIIQNLIIFLITTAPIYYVVKWINLGLKK